MDDKIFGNPKINKQAYVSTKATLIGQIIVDQEVFVAPYACLRADEGRPFKICAGTNIQDGVIFHGLLEQFVYLDGQKYAIYIGPNCSIAHGAIVHGPTAIDENTFIGFRTVIHNAVIGQQCYIGHGAIINGVHIADKRFVPDGLVVNTQAQTEKLGLVPDKLQAFNHEVVEYNKKLVKLYKQRKQ